MGDLSTIAARVQYLSAEQKNFVDITVKDLAVDPALGGSHVDQRVKQYLIQKYNENHQPLGSSPKLHARFLREATRVKTILSANLFVIASLENIHGVDFRYRMERSELDELCKDLFDRSIVPLNSVLANTTLDEIEALVMVGGGVRIPAVQKKLVERVDGKLARNVDGDEAAVQGAVLHAASKSSLFQLGTTLRVKDLFLDQVEIVYGSERKMLFSPKSVMGLKKYSTIPYIKDFDFQIIMAGKKLCTVFVQGITKAIASGKAGKVRFEFKISDSGMFQIVDALFIANSTVITEQEKPDEGDNAGSVLDLLTKSNDSSKAPASAVSLCDVGFKSCLGKDQAGYKN